MTINNSLTIVGNITSDPELRYTQSGLAVANFTIAQTERIFDRGSNEWKDGATTFIRVSIWRQAAENIAASLKKGNRVIAVGKLKQTEYETKEGEKRTSFELDDAIIGASLEHATLAIHRNTNQEPPANVAQSTPATAPAAAPQQTAVAPTQAAAAPAAAPAAVAASQAVNDDVF